MARRKPRKNRDMRKFYPAFALVVLVIVIASLFQLSQIQQYRAGQGPASSHPPTQNTDLNQSKPPQIQNSPKFFFQVIPLRDSFYTGGRVVTLVSIVSNQTQNYYLTGEWFAYEGNLNTTIPIPESIYNETFFLQKNQIVGQYRWNLIPDKNATNATFRATLKDDSGRAYVQNVSVKLIRKDETLPYLAENSVVRSNDTITIFALMSLRSVNPSDFDQAGILLNLTRNYLSPAMEMNETNSLEVFDEKRGDSLGFSSFYAMLLRSIGIPAKVMTCSVSGKAYYYDEILIEGKGWLNADVYNSAYGLGQGAKPCLNATAIY